MLRLSHRQLEVRIDNDPSFTFGSVDNPHAYDHAYRLDDEPYNPTSLHTVRVTQENDKAIASCILGASGGASGVHEHSAIIHGDSLLIAVGPFVAFAAAHEKRTGADLVLEGSHGCAVFCCFRCLCDAVVEIGFELTW
jgi:hypothetical protein